MSRVILLSCLPWLGLLLGTLAFLVLLARAGQARVDWHRLRQLHEEQTGSAQSLSFVLTLPLFVWAMMLIVQVSQLMIAQVVLEYAAFAAARSATVWIPARVDPAFEPVNSISAFAVDPEAPDQVYPITNSSDPNYGPIEGGLTYLVAPGSPKYGKIASAALLALMPVCPSRDLGATLPAQSVGLADAVRDAYVGMTPGSAAGPEAIDRRVRNKLAYAMENTSVELRFYHTNRYPEPPLMTYYILPDPDQFRFNEMGWQDTVTVKVKHDLALLPGPGRLLWRWRNVGRAGGAPDTGAERITHNRRTYTYPLEASATLGIEGLEPVVPYENPLTY
jgi:hypothetical protein